MTSRRNISAKCFRGKLFWRQDIGTIGGVTLRLFGLNSTILSGAGIPAGQKDTTSSLYLSSLQTGFEAADNVVNLAMCHHPFNWFMDEEQVRDAFENRTTIQFFGHNHVSRTGKNDGWVRFEAGAINPDPYLTGWEPGYNLIEIDVSNSGRDRKLNIKAHVFAWQRNPDCYRAKRFSAGRDYYTHTIEIPEPKGVSGASSAGASSATTESQSPQGAREAESRMGETHTRRLIYRFWNLTMSQRREIAQRLSLLSPEELELPDAERYGLALLRASEREQLDQLADEISRMEGK